MSESRDLVSIPEYINSDIHDVNILSEISVTETEYEVYCSYPQVSDHILSDYTPTFGDESGDFVPWVMLARRAT
jgi:hypothetical protein